MLLVLVGALGSLFGHPVNRSMLLVLVGAVGLSFGPGVSGLSFGPEGLSFGPEVSFGLGLSFAPGALVGIATARIHQRT